ncbi:MAG: PepSY domain-containing protein [Gammaproteobacteria bacterium]|nr:PepSY domain-containing protein [Gammaproteobacteria bacterium]
MKTIRTLAALFLSTSLAACAGMWQDEEVAIGDVPAAAITAAEGAVPGLEIRAAEVERKNGRTVYEIDGRAKGVKHEVKVTADGEVLKVKTDD